MLNAVVISILCVWAHSFLLLFFNLGKKQCNPIPYLGGHLLLVHCMCIPYFEMPSIASGKENPHKNYTFPCWHDTKMELII